jgi:putative transposase
VGGCALRALRSRRLQAAESSPFVTELSLKISSAQERALLVRLDCARQVYNACLGESLKRLKLLRESKAYRAARKLPKGPKGSPQAKTRERAFRRARAAVGFREYDLHTYAAQFNHCWIGEHLDINTIQKLATRAFSAVNEYALGKHGKPRFKGKNQFDSVEGKSNASGIRWRDGQVEWLELELKAIVYRHDPVIAHGLNSRVKYVRIVRRKLNGRNRFYAQLVCEGTPLPPEKRREIRKKRKKDEAAEEQKGRPTGDVGLDLGPSTIAVVSEHDAFLEQFCPELKDKQKQIRRLQRKIDRERRANNPDNYLPDGRIRSGPKTWRKSARQKRTETKLAELHRKLAAQRKSLHGRLVNRILRMGSCFKLEKLSYRAFQRQYGKSVGKRAPGKFVELLKRKAESAGDSAVEFPTRTTRLSQTCHGCGTVEEKPLSQRQHICDCGIEAQRDLYSAFLATCVVPHDDTYRLDAALAHERWAGAEPLLRAASSRTQLASNGRKPVSPAQGTEPVARESAVRPAEARVVVPREGESPGKAAPVGGRTPCL